jgi:hypothetical protein
LNIRDKAVPREHLFADFLGPVYGRYQILVLVDYATGYSMLIPTNGNDAVTVIEAILTRWVPIFGWFKTLETDWGAGFESGLLHALMKASGVRIEMAEPRNHRSIGKVERVIGMIQSVINSYNMQLNNELTDGESDYEEKWRTVEILLPFIQTALNQRRPRFTTFSPNMLMFGQNVNDITDIGRIRKRIERYQKEEEFNLTTKQYEYLNELTRRIKVINKKFTKDWKKYTWETKQAYDTRYRIRQESITKYKKLFKINQKVFYYIGDKKTTQGKWRRKWTGPWTIHKVLNDSTLIILDTDTKALKRVSFDRIKRFNDKQLTKTVEDSGQNDDFERYRKNLLDRLKGRVGKIRKPNVELDYNIEDDNIQNQDKIKNKNDKKEDKIKKGKKKIKIKRRNMRKTK